MSMRCRGVVLSLLLGLIATPGLVCAGTGDESPSAVDKTTGLTLSVDFNKSAYALGEPIIVRLTITNNGNSSVTDRWFSYTRGFYLELEDVSGKPVYMVMEESLKEKIITDWVYALPPGKSVTTAFDLTRGDIIGKSSFFPRLAKRATPPEQRIPGYVVETGVYRLIATQDLSMNRTADGDRIRLRASKEFTIRAPTVGERNALDLFEMEPYFAGADASEAEKAAAEQSLERARARYSRIRGEYPTTPFGPYGIYYSTRIVQYRGELDGAVHSYTALLERYPDFPLAADVLYYHAIALRELGREYLSRQMGEKLAEQYANHLIQPDVPMKEKGSRIQLLLKELDIRPER